MNEIRDLIVGIDFGKEYSQICYYDRKGDEARSLSMKAGGNQYEASRMTQSSRHTAKSISGALRGSRRGASRTRRSMHGAKKLEKRNRNVTEILSR